MILVGILVTLQVVDGWTTYKIISNRFGREANFLVDAIIGRLGLFWGLVVVKGFALAAIAVTAYYGGWNSDVGQGLLLALDAFYVWVCWNNLRILYGSR